MQGEFYKPKATVDRCSHRVTRDTMVVGAENRCGAFFPHSFQKCLGTHCFPRE